MLVGKYKVIDYMGLDLGRRELLLYDWTHIKPWRRDYVFNNNSLVYTEQSKSVKSKSTSFFNSKSVSFVGI